MSALNKIELTLGFRSRVIALLLTIAAPAATAEIIIQTSNGSWVSSPTLSEGSHVMPSLVFSPTIRGSSGFLVQRASAWSSYRRPDNTTGLLLADPFGNGSSTATSSQQANVRNHLARASAYRLNYFSK